MKAEFRDQGTPLKLFHACDEKFGPFIMDAAAILENAKCPNFITPNDNSLKADWPKHLERWGTFPERMRRVWLCPPPGNLMEWVQKALKERDKNGMQTTMLLPEAIDAFWFHLLLESPCRIIFIKGKVRYINPDGLPVRPYGETAIIVNLNTFDEGTRFGSLYLNTLKWRMVE